jgi:Ca-activated chloride channel family protein
MKNELLKSPLKLLSILFAALFLFVSANAQTTPTPTPKTEEVVEDEGGVLRVSSALVVVPVSVTDANGQPVQNLTKNDFRLEEEGRGQTIEEVGNAEQVPLEIALLFDVSSSVNKIFEIEKDAAAKFLQSVMKPEDRATLFLIGEKPYVSQNRLTAEEMAVKVRAIKPAGVTTATAFYDTVTAASEFLRKNSPERSRRVILVLSDGEDNFSEFTRKSETAIANKINVNTVTQKELNERASRATKVHLQAQTKVLHDLQNADTVFYSINPSGPSVRLNLASQRAQNGLQRFANETGGTSFLPSILQPEIGRPLESSGNVKRNAETLDQIFRQISAELRAQYLLQYYSETEFPKDKYVKLKVDLNNRATLRVRSRQGYFAKGQ